MNLLIVFFAIHDMYLVENYVTISGVCTDDLINKLLRGIVHDVFGAYVADGSDLTEEDEEGNDH